MNQFSKLSIISVVIIAFGLMNTTSYASSNSLNISDSSYNEVQKQNNKNILIPIITNKRYVKYKYDDNIWFDITWNTDNLKKKVRAVKGILNFADLFGESKFRIKYTINDSLSPGNYHNEEGIGFEYNQFKDSHKWMRSSDLKDMTFQYNVKSIIYADGTTEQFK
jgi:hypothetical protein